MAFLAALLIAAPVVVKAQFTTQVTWSTVSFVYHGDVTPNAAYASLSPGVMTPLGAAQMYDAGNVVRQRYIDPPAAGTQLTTDAVVNGISVDTINNAQLYLLGLDDAYLTTGAMAFMQGLYPPVNVMSEMGQEQNGTFQNYPLGGYQYPNINAAGTLDYNYIWTAGNEKCPQWSLFEARQVASTSFQSTYNNTLGIYTELASSMFSALDPTTLNFYNAFELYEYALYQWNHNTTFQNNTSFTLDDLSTLYNLAYEQQIGFLAPQEEADGSTNFLPSIAAQTLASTLITQFEHNIDSHGISDKMTFLFGSHEPITSFFSLSGLSTGPSGGQFKSLPLHGSVLSFELFSYITMEEALNETTATSVPFPDSTDLYVRFLFRNGTTDRSPLVSYSLFNRPNEETDIPWSDFIQAVNGFAIYDVLDWCAVCGAMNLFCLAIEEDITNNPNASGGNSDSKKKLHPIIAGVIGSIITLALFLLMAAGLALLGCRISVFFLPRKGGEDIHKAGFGRRRRSASAFAGGFKGKEKLPSDTDLRLKDDGETGNVGRHERVGSWELNDSTGAGAGDGKSKVRSLDKEIDGDEVFGLSRKSEDEDLDLGGRAVVPREHV